jgi:hypothetical protein
MNDMATAVTDTNAPMLSARNAAPMIKGLQIHVVEQNTTDDVEDIMLEKLCCNRLQLCCENSAPWSVPHSLTHSLTHLMIAANPRTIATGTASCHKFSCGMRMLVPHSSALT